MNGMSIWMGIDEVGYGPRLGPLVIALYSLKGSSFNEKFWQQNGFESDPRKWREVLVVCDSKELYKSQAGIKRLESSAQALSPGLDNFFGWLKQLSDATSEDFKQYPWYEKNFTLPLEAEGSLIEAHRERFQKKLKEIGMEVGPCLVRAVLERRFNSMLKSHNKSRLEFEVIIKMLEQQMALSPDEDFYVDVDKLGGRDRYSEMLGAAFPMQEIQIISESRNQSDYKLPGLRLQIRFSKGADSFSFPVAAASILAKYTRELFMKNLNDYWCGKIEGLKPTAGYPEDAKRFMEVVMPQLLASGYGENWMVREK
jgi:ribonuclease HII